MKKILFAAMALGMCMTSCMNDEFPNAVQYGYINLNVSNDPTLQTRADVNVEDLSKWVIETQQGTEGERKPWSKETAYTAGKYTVYAYSRFEGNSWQTANNNYGAAYYEGCTEEPVNVQAGMTATANINCGTAQNAKLTVTITDMPNAFGNIVVNAVRKTGITLALDGSTHKEAFFEAEEEVSYSINYTYNGASKEITNQTIKMAGRATDNIITIKANENGLISVKITYDDSFGEGESEDFTFDAATGEIQQ
jgi:hypothetical protein